ncbi:DUF3526 domain-containing protein [Glaciecola sp. MH2013]|uniref:DUF3526 domain-containing protein n=1 Tax=Glaciecola sp. MH2013 TaxID=2785524 RepID=UPI0018A02F5A|nr:DUF3526 domain-containing protein [Glaciecola sp. MH2013]MBF7074253.1 DUF3526 domain-containing protein [Glaciecola sp. MH2013]
MVAFTKHIAREWRFMLRQRYVLILLVCAFILSSFAVFTGVSEVSSQRQTIERLKLADETDRLEAQAKYDDPGSLAYYTFHLSYSEPSNLAFAALGERDTYPWKHRIRMLALEGQIYESDAQNAELAQAGKIDFTFVIAALSPLLLILLFHDLSANERTSGRHDLLVTTAKMKIHLWGARIVVRLLAVFLCLLLPFYVAAFISDTAWSSIALVSLWCFAYFIFWTLISVYVGRKSSSAPRVASALIAIWVLFVFILPILGDLAIKQAVHSPKGGDILMVQREAVNAAWDLPVETTMDAFVAKHPKYANYKKEHEGFNWGWYYAFQQVGDQTAANLSQAYADASQRKYDFAAYVAMLSPPMLLQRKMTRLANSDAIAAFQYEKEIRSFHAELREFYYPWLFLENDFDKAVLSDLPNFNNNENQHKKQNKVDTNER